jgi:flavorubredoxin
VYGYIRNRWSRRTLKRCILVGAIDWNGRDFHAFTTTSGGTTYNSYLVIGEKTALIDTVKAPFAGEMLRRIGQLIDLSKLDYSIMNHMEPDHSGSLTELKNKPTLKFSLQEEASISSMVTTQTRVVKTGMSGL